MSVKLIQAIYCTKEKRGTGTESDPVRSIVEIFDVDGNLLAEDDSMSFRVTDAINFAKYYYESKCLKDNKRTDQDIFWDWFNHR